MEPGPCETPIAALNKAGGAFRGDVATLTRLPQYSLRQGLSTAAAAAAGGYDSIFEAARHMAHVQKLTFRPRREDHEIYNRLFKEYQTLHDYFGRGANDVMKRLKALKKALSGQPSAVSTSG